ncbi:MAG: glutathione S-transferase N-terminal domain-containing protein [Pseudomonadota bacterium]
MPAPLKLHTFSVSHFSEKARWLLDASGIDYVEEPWVPFLHIVKTLRKGGRGATTVPILDTGEGCIQDSTRILLWLEKHRAPFSLMPVDAALREQVLAVEDRFDRVGNHVVRYAYSVSLDNAEGVTKLWTIDATPGQTRFIRAAYPLLRMVFRSKLKLGNAAAVAASEQRFGEGLDWIAEQIKDGRRYLVGTQLTAADITAAALLAPIACPDEHPVYSQADYRDGIAPLRAKWAGHPALDWVRQLYRDHRRT